MPINAAQSIRFAVAKANIPAKMHLLLYVVPGATQEGIAAITHKRIKMYVAARPKNGEANEAIRGVIADALKVPQSDVEITRGLKGRKKIVAVNWAVKEETATEEIARVRKRLVASLKASDEKEGKTGQKDESWVE